MIKDHFKTWWPSYLLLLTSIIAYGKNSEYAYPFITFITFTLWNFYKLYLKKK
jgi:hypothetical protein